MIFFNKLKQLCICLHKIVLEPVYHPQKFPHVILHLDPGPISNISHHSLFCFFFPYLLHWLEVPVYFPITILGKGIHSFTIKCEVSFLGVYFVKLRNSLLMLDCFIMVSFIRSYQMTFLCLLK